MTPPLTGSNFFDKSDVLDPDICLQHLLFFYFPLSYLTASDAPFLPRLYKPLTAPLSKASPSKPPACEGTVSFPASAFQCRYLLIVI